MVEVWNERFPLPDNDFEFLEPLLALRTSMLLTLVKLRANKSSSREGLINQARTYKDLATHLEMQAKVARRSHNPQVHWFVSYSGRSITSLVLFLFIENHLSNPPSPPPKLAVKLFSCGSWFHLSFEHFMTSIRIICDRLQRKLCSE